MFVNSHPAPIIGYRRDGRPIRLIAGGAPNAVLDRLLDQRSDQEKFISEMLERVSEEDRDLVEAEQRNLDAARERIEQLDKQIKPLEEFERTRSAHRSSQPEPPRGNSGGEEHRAGGREQRLGASPREQKYPSAGHFLTDYIRSVGYPGAQLRPDVDAQQRVQAAMQSRAVTGANTTTETPGVMPEPIIGQILTDIDGSRPFVQSIGVKDLAGIPGKNFSRPHVTQHTQVGEQTAETDDLTSRQFKIEGIAFTKKTFGGTLTVSRQDIDWTSPGAWNALISDLQLEYGEDTEDAAGAAFGTAVTQSQEIALADKDSLPAWVDALYLAAVQAATANGTVRARARRLPNHVWASIDMWASLGSLLSAQRLQNFNSGGASTPTAFSGDIVDIPRTMVPGLPTGTLIVGRSDQTEFYEERIGLLQAVQPKILGVEVAYGGYAAYGTLEPTAFCKITVATA